MSDANSDAYIAQGFRAKSEGSWRWAHEHPELRFYLPQIGQVKFTATFSFPEQNLKLTGPVTISFSINGHFLDRARYESPGEKQFTRRVPPEYLKQNGLNLVSIEPDKVAEPNPGEKLSFILIRAGFVE